MSSDSEDDFYDNITERLQKEKDKFQDDKTETVNLSDDSAELDEIVKNNKIPAKNKRKSGAAAKAKPQSSTVSDLPDVSVDNVISSLPKRMTRSRAKSSSVEVPVAAGLPARQRSSCSASESSTSTATTTTRGRGKGAGRRGRGKSTSSESNIDTGTPRGRARGGRTSRARRTPRGRSWRSRAFMCLHEDHFNLAPFLSAFMQPLNPNSYDPSIPTYSIGNTAEYPDQSHNQPLFSNTNKEKTDEVVVVEEDNSEENEELSVKVYWQSSEFFKFTIRRFQKLTQIFEYFAKKENIERDKLLFTYNDKILKPDDTPESIDYKIIKFIDGGVVTQGVSELLTKEELIKDGIVIKFQCQNMKKRLEVTIRKDDKLSLAMMKCAELLEKPLDQLRFEFDGDSISGKATPQELEFEGGECIDVRTVS